MVRRARGSGRGTCCSDEQGARRGPASPNDPATVCAYLRSRWKVMEGQGGTVPRPDAMAARELLNARYASLSGRCSNHENLFVSGRAIFLPGLLAVWA